MKELYRRVKVQLAAFFKKTLAFVMLPNWAWLNLLHQTVLHPHPLIAIGVVRTFGRVSRISGLNHQV